MYLEDYRSQSINNITQITQPQTLIATSTFHKNKIKIRTPQHNYRQLLLIVINLALIQFLLLITTSNPLELYTIVATNCLQIDFGYYYFYRQFWQR